MFLQLNKWKVSIKTFVMRCFVAFEAFDASSRQVRTVKILFESVNILRAHVASHHPSSQPNRKHNELFLYFKYGKVSVRVAVMIQTAGEQNSARESESVSEEKKTTSKENYEWNIWRTFVARLCLSVKRRRVQAESWKFVQLGDDGKQIICRRDIWMFAIHFIRSTKSRVSWRVGILAGVSSHHQLFCDSNSWCWTHNLCLRRKSNQARI